MLKFNKLARSTKVLSASLVLTAVVVGSGFSNMGLVKSSENLWTQDGNVVKLTEESRELSIGGVVQSPSRMSMGVATTTPCAIQNGTATTSIASLAMQINVGTSTEASFDISTSTTAFATSTPLITGYTVASGARNTLSWFPSSFNNALVAPYEWVVFKTIGAGLGGYTFGGVCSVNFIQP